MNTISTAEETALYITFSLADEMFAVDVSQVREILDSSTITRIPRAPEFMRGVINVRGSVVPVLDMRLKFGMEGVARTANTRIIVLELNQGGETLVLGAMADSVKDVIELDHRHIEPPPKIGSRWRTEFIRGIGKYEDSFIIILDIDRLFSTDELAVVEAAAADGATAPQA